MINQEDNCRIRTVYLVLFYEDLEIKLSEVEEELVGVWVLVLKIILVPLQQFLVSNGCL